MKIDANRYGPTAAQLLQLEAPYPLVPKTPVQAARANLSALDHAALFGGAKVTDRQMADACISGLWLLFDFLDESHSISQSIHAPTGSFWHGIMHRREPDWSNAKYWFNRTGQHEVFDDLAAEAARLAQDYPLDAQSGWLAKGGPWDPFAFVDLCQSASRGGGDAEELCRQVQLAEWRLLFDWCYRRATA